MSDTILTEIDNGVGIITLNRAERHNAFDDATIAELTDAMEKMAGDDAVRLVVIKETERGFREFLQRRTTRNHPLV